MYIASSNLFVKTDLIIIALLVALGFTFMENNIYMLEYTKLLASPTEQLSGGVRSIFSRSIVWFLVHMLFTGSIARAYVRGRQQRNSIRITVAAALGISLHMLYNTLLHFNFSFVVILYIIASYFFLTRLLYASDGMYVERKAY